MKGKKCFLALLLCGFIFSANALSVSFQLVQKDFSQNEIRAASYVIEDSMFEYFFDKGIVVSNLPILIYKNENTSDLALINSVGESRLGGINYLVSLCAEYDVSHSINPEAVSLDNISNISWKIINIDTDEVVTKGEEKKNDVQKKSNKKDALESFSYLVAQKIYNSIRSNM